jgi:hypothetical protein
VARRRIPTKKELLQLQKIYRTDRKIGQALGGVPEHLVAYWRRKKGIGRSTFPKYSYLEIKELWERYGDDFKAGQQLGITKQAFYRWRKQYKLLERPTILKLEQLELKFYDENRLSRTGQKQAPAQTVLQKIAAYHNSQSFAHIQDKVRADADLLIRIDENGVRALSVTQPGKARRRKQIWERYDSILDLLESGYFVPGQLVLSDRLEATGLAASASYINVLPRLDADQDNGNHTCEFAVNPSFKLSVRGSTTLRLSPFDIACQIAKCMEGATEEDYFLELSGPAIERATLDERIALLSYIALLLTSDVFVEPDQTFMTYLQRLSDAKAPVPFSDKNSHNLDSRELTLGRSKPRFFDLGKGRFLDSYTTLARSRLRRVRVGPLVGGSLDSIRTLANAIKGTTISPQLEVFVLPATNRIFGDAARKRYVQHLLDAGIRIGNIYPNPALEPLKKNEFELTTEINPGTGRCILTSIDVIAQALRHGRMTKRLFDSG